jgi:hypothetical protein
MKRLARLVALGALLAVAAGCGESEPVTVYKQGEYQGKPDTRPWDNAQFKNDRAGWEKTIKARNGNQNEYARAAN